MKKNLVLLALNEINFDVVRNYIHDHHLPSIKKLFDSGIVETCSEEKYELLEPWIQWVSVHTGLRASEHEIYRLGDVVYSENVSQVFEEVESAGYSVGAISPMNAVNKLSKPAYFIPDPWTKTPSDGSFWSESLSEMVSQAVNDNASQKISLRSYFFLILGIIRFARLKNYLVYFKLAITSRGKSWRKALFLDLFLHDLHISLLRKSECQFSTLFLNSGAHIQHHYFFNARHGKSCLNKNPEWYLADGMDPFAEMLSIYDRIIGDYLSINKSYALMISTGLSQVPYDRIKYYYRLNSHNHFLGMLGIDYIDVHPRMTRDFLITFSDAESAKIAEYKLDKIVAKTDGQRIFGEIDNRGNSLFVTLTYPNEIDDGFKIASEGDEFDLSRHISFVAIKNGMHSPKGFFSSVGTSSQLPHANGMNIAAIYSLIRAHFGLKTP